MIYGPITIKTAEINLTTEAYIPGPIIELSFSLENSGALDLKNIGNVNLIKLQYFLTALPYVESKVTLGKKIKAATLDFYFKIEYLNSIYKLFPDTLGPLLHDYYGGKPHHFYNLFLYCTKELKHSLMEVIHYIFNKHLLVFDYTIFDYLVHKLFFQALNRKKTMAYPKLSRQNQNKILEIGSELKNNPDRLIKMGDLVKTTTTNQTTLKKGLYGSLQ